MKNKELFESIGKHKQIFAIGFDLTDKDDRLQDADIQTYIEFNDISTDEVMMVVGDIIGRFIHNATRTEKVRTTMLKRLVSSVAKSMDGTEKEPKKDDPSMQDIRDTLSSIKSLLEVMKTIKED